MPVSMALNKSARDFSLKYACTFDFETFESSVEEFTFLRPNNGWRDVYKTMFARLYKQALESAIKARGGALDGEAMLDDFEYTLIRPYVNEGDREIRHKPYVEMDRVSRLAYLQQLTSQSPSNSVDLYAEKYKSGELSIKQIRSGLALGEENREHYVEMAGCVQALENVNKGRPLIWRVLHPFKNNAEKRISEQIKRAFFEQTHADEAFFTENAAAAYETFDGHQRVIASLEERMIHAREEMNRNQKMRDAIRESVHVEGFERESLGAFSPKIEPNKGLAREKEI